MASSRLELRAERVRSTPGESNGAFDHTQATPLGPRARLSVGSGKRATISLRGSSQEPLRAENLKLDPGTCREAVYGARDSVFPPTDRSVVVAAEDPAGAQSSEVGVDIGADGLAGVVAIDVCPVERLDDRRCLNRRQAEDANPLLTPANRAATPALMASMSAWQDARRPP